MEPSRIHELNKIAGAFCGKEMEERNSRWFTIMTFPEGNVLSEWSPCTDHNQAAEVKAKLREKGYEYEISWYRGKYHDVMIWEAGTLTDRLKTISDGQHESEPTALLLAVEALGKEEEEHA